MANIIQVVPGQARGGSFENEKPIAYTAEQNCADSSLQGAGFRIYLGLV